MSVKQEGAPSGFEQEVQRRLRSSAESLPASVHSRLTVARHAALEAASRRRLPVPGGRGWRRWAPAGAAAAALLAVAWLLWPLRPGIHTVNAGGPTNGALENMDLLAQGELVGLSPRQNLDYEFYEWAADEAENSGASTSTGGT